MKQYGIYIRCNGGTPYMIHFYDNILSAKQELFDMIQLEEDRGRPYFVDNDFFNNKYSCNLNLKYFVLKKEMYQNLQFIQRKNKEQKIKIKSFIFKIIKIIIDI